MSEVSDDTDISRREPTRRGALGLIAGLGAGAGLAGARAQDPDGLTRADIACAESLAGIDYTPGERAQILEGVDAWLARAEALRAAERPNTLAPAQTFDPRLPGVAYAVQDDRFEPGPAPAAPLAATERDIAYASIAQLQAWMSAGAITSERLTAIYLDRIARHAPALECFIHVARGRALDEARRRDAERAAGHGRGPLHGVPYALKDIIDVAGLPSTWGASLYADRVAETTAVCAARLEAAGAVLLGKTTAGALAYGDIWYDGVTRNPFNPEEGSSGSSAGSASAVASGLCAFAIGTETLGSIISPSHRCGAAGLRPTFGRVARTGAMALCWSLDKIGPITRYAADAAPVLAAINGADDGDPASLDRGFTFEAGLDLSGLRLGYDPAWFEAAAEPDRAALDAARDLGVSLKEVRLQPKPYDGLLIQLEAEAAAAFEHLTLSDLDDRLRWQEPAAWPNTWRRARFSSAIDYVNADRLRREAMTAVHALFDEADALIGPNFAGDMLVATNFTGHPQMAIRSGFTAQPTRTLFGAPADREGARRRVPHATSLWAPLFEEDRLIALASALEAALGAADERPPEFS